MAVDYKALKKGGLMRQKQKDCFCMRLKSVGGHFTAAQLKTIQEVSEKYGKGYIHLTARQGIEIPFIRLQQIDTVKAELAKGGVHVGVCGPRVRTITACQGSATCPSAWIDTLGLAQKFDDRYAGREFPHKFKFGFTGCYNNCLKTEENDLGIKGGVEPKWNENLCTYCGVCQAVCPAQAITVDKANKKVVLDEEKCVYCGKCIKSCPTDSWEGEPGFVLSFGGTYGSHIRIGKHVLPILYDEDTLFKVVDRTLAFYTEYGKPSERFGITLERVGWEKFKAALEEVR